MNPRFYGCVYLPWKLFATARVGVAPISGTGTAYSVVFAAFAGELGREYFCGACGLGGVMFRGSTRCGIV
jgi:hypothetical protein